jgi:hypothetical protein
MSDLLKRVGKFKISRDLLREDGNESLLKLFANTIIVRAEYLYPEDSIKYIALSPLFRTKEECEIVPEYRMICTNIYTGSDNEVVDIAITAEEIK